jgi:hypothetical protein
MMVSIVLPAMAIRWLPAISIPVQHKPLSDTCRTKNTAIFLVMEVATSFSFQVFYFEYKPEKENHADTLPGTNPPISLLSISPKK